MTDIARLIVNANCYINILIVLLEYIHLFNPSDSMKQSFGRGCPIVYHSVLLYFILSLAVVAKCILLELAPIMPAFYSLFLPSYFSKNYAGKIGASLIIILDYL